MAALEQPEPRALVEECEATDGKRRRFDVLTLSVQPVPHQVLGESVGAAACSADRVATVPPPPLHQTAPSPVQPTRVTRSESVQTEHSQHGSPNNEDAVREAKAALLQQAHATLTARAGLALQEEEVAALRQEVEKMQAEDAARLQQLQAKRTRVAMAEAALSQAKVEADKWMKSEKQFQNALRVSKEEAEAARSLAEREISQIARSKESLIAILTGAIADSDRALGCARDDVHHFRELYLEAQRSACTDESSLESSLNDKDAKVCCAPSSDLSEVVKLALGESESALARARDEVAQLEWENQEMQSKMAQAEEEANNTRHKAEQAKLEAEATLAKAEEEKHNLTLKNKQLECSLKDLQASLEEREDLLVELERKRHELCDALANAERANAGEALASKEAKDLRAQLMEARHDERMAQEKARETQAQAESFRKLCTTSRIRALTAGVKANDAEKAAESARTELRRVEEELVEAQRELAEVRSTAQKALDDGHRARADADEASAQLSVVKAEIKGWIFELKSAQEVAARSASEAAKASAEKSQIEAEIRDARDKLELLSSDLEEARLLEGKARTDADDAVEKLVEWERIACDAKAQALAFRLDLETTTATLTRVRTEAVENEDRIQQARAEASFAKAKANEAEVNLDTARHTMKTLQRSIDCLQSEVADQRRLSAALRIQMSKVQRDVRKRTTEADDLAKRYDEAQVALASQAATASTQKTQMEAQMKCIEERMQIVSSDLTEAKMLERKARTDADDASSKLLESEKLARDAKSHALACRLEMEAAAATLAQVRAEADENLRTAQQALADVSSARIEADEAKLHLETVRRTVEGLQLSLVLRENDIAGQRRVSAALRIQLAEGQKATRRCANEALTLARRLQEAQLVINQLKEDAGLLSVGLRQERETSQVLTAARAAAEAVAEAKAAKVEDLTEKIHRLSETVQELEAEKCRREAECTQREMNRSRDLEHAGATNARREVHGDMLEGQTFGSSSISCHGRSSEVELCKVHLRATASQQALLGKFAEIAGITTFSHEHDAHFDGELRRHIEEKLCLQLARTTEFEKDIKQLQLQVREAQDREAEATEQASRLEAKLHASRLEAEASNAKIAVLRSQSCVGALEADEKVKRMMTEHSQMQSRVAELEGELEEARSASRESERKRMEIHRCLVDLSAGVSAHRQHVQALKETHAHRDKAHAKEIARLQRENEALSYSVKRLHAEGQKQKAGHATGPNAEHQEPSVFSVGVATSKQSKGASHHVGGGSKTTVPRIPLRRVDSTVVNRSGRNI